MTKSDKKRYRFLLVLGSIGLALVLGELLLRFIAEDRYSVWQPNKVVIFRPAQGVMPGVDGRSRFITNDDGIRGEPIPPGDAYRILTMGGSTTECLFLDQLETWPHLLQERLNKERLSGPRVWVGNVGKSGLTTQHHVVQIEKLVDQHPELQAVVLLVGVNDFIIRLARGESYRPAPPLKEMSPLQYENLLDQSFAVWPGSDRHLPIYKRTEIYRRWHRYRKLHVSPPDAAIVQDRAGRFYERFRQNRREASAIRTKLPNLSAALAEYERNLMKIIAIAKSTGVRLIFVTQPFLWYPDLTERERRLIWAGGIGTRHQFEPGHPYYSVSALAKGMGIYNDRLLQVCAREQVEVVDLQDRIPRSAAYFYDGMHFNEKGARQVASLLCKYLLPTL